MHSHLCLSLIYMRHVIGGLQRQQSVIVPVKPIPRSQSMRPQLQGARGRKGNAFSSASFATGRPARVNRRGRCAGTEH